ncbi:MAG: CDP-diacylglycerol--glycerol-3-phosphate 3-phosphatidyltransferase [Candidatus Riflebacteria bacterium]|nr:CDP-diacylglycerol--glycerol-3-phosphate 3-phosphatidyltransferase [Candidatus Riflebacteria bacterium]
MDAPDRKGIALNLANCLTLFRIFAAPFLVALLVADSGPPGLAGDWGKVVAIFLTLVAGLTDVYDGIVARAMKTVSTFGKFSDPVADKLLVTALFVSFVELGRVPAWIVVLILFREFAVLGLRLLLVGQGMVMTPTDWAKFKTIFQISAAVAIMIPMDLQVLVLSGKMSVPWISMLYYAQIADFTTYVALVFTLITGAEYFVLYWRHLE